MPDLTQTAYLCTTCGVQFVPSTAPPDHCPICEDERQYVGPKGQHWTTLPELRQQGHENQIRQLEPGLFSITTEPRFGIGQRALLLQTPGGNVLWDCVAFIDERTVAAIHDMGGISAIAISHPHYYSAMVEWSRAFGDAPIFLHAADREWVQRPDAAIRFWEGAAKELLPGITLLCTGGHFAGFNVLHRAQGAERRGALLSGDQPQIAADPRWVSFMYSYPNMIPLNAAAIRRVVDALVPYPFDRLYSAFLPGIVAHDAKAVVVRSAERYLKAIAD